MGNDCCQALPKVPHQNDLKQFKDHENISFEAGPNSIVLSSNESQSTQQSDADLAVIKAYSKLSFK